MNVPAQRRSAPQQITLTSLIAGLTKGDSTTRSGTVTLAMQILNTPANGQWIAGRMVTLLSHYFQPGQDAKASAAAGGDWIKILSKYPQCVVEEAADEWMRTKTHRPTPAHMVGICDRHLQRITSALPKQSAPPPPVNRVQADKAKQIIQEVLGK